MRDLRLAGPSVTPHVLAAVEKATEGDSVSANLALARNNASVAGQVAAAIAAQ